MKEQEKSAKEANTTHHISSGGFIFYKNNKTEKIYVLLVKNKKGEYWIPKGHLEEGETQEEAAFREIEEETTINRGEIKYVGFCSLIKYTFVEDGHQNSKEVYLNVFKASEKNDLTPHVGDDEISEIRWFEYAEALRVIDFNKKELIKSKELFDEYMES